MSIFNIIKQLPQWPLFLKFNLVFIYKDWFSPQCSVAFNFQLCLSIVTRQNSPRSRLQSILRQFGIVTIVVIVAASTVGRVCRYIYDSMVDISDDRCTVQKRSDSMQHRHIRACVCDKNILTRHCIATRRNHHSV